MTKSPAGNAPSMWGRLALTVVALALAGSGCGEDDESARGASSRVERCVDRLAGVVVDMRVTDDLRRYLRTAHCEPSERRGWLYENGTFSIDVYRNRGEAVCVSQRPGEPAVTTSCPEDPVLDCAILRHVRRSEVRAYIAERRRHQKVRCDDGTPLDELGVEE